MDFTGTWKVYSEENLEEFLKVLGAPEMIVKMRKEVKPVIVIEQSGKDFTFTMKTPFFSRVNSFTVGKEAEISYMDGRKLKCTIREEDGKLISETDKFTSVREIRGDEMIETTTAGSVTFISRSKRV
ncbi:fatty acid-binding protein, liver [Kryptolebias marmoratus]|uniref:fatty acid-binding protein, liver n=1 Tax=Kryptolebias marmoratus TaxID=37003 RepID=UPI0007F90C36|nr:fatty acid-binding protein, liver [Kryptolebias marmoratus]